MLSLAAYFLNPIEAEQAEDAPQQFDPVHASSVLDAPWAHGTGRHPLLVLSTGWGAPLTAYSTLAEQLASEGNIVLGIEHPGGSGTMVLPDGTTYPFVPLDPAALDSLEGVADAWSSDIGAVAVAALDARSTAGVFAHRIDATRIGALGHSLGGAAAVLAASRLPLIRAAADLDGSLWGEVRMQGPTQPVLLMLSQDHLATEETLQGLVDHRRGPVYTVSVRGSAHLDYSDINFWFAFASQSDPTLTAADANVGPIGAYRMLTITTRYVSAFFGETLLHEPSALLHGPSAEFPEVQASP
ncbi:MAG: hypothetical protein JWN04_5308 [Myxococcaceae bacterium]|nr:hypothetical protein [Myxococcaceae bacterium]